jgi:Transposase DDE domain
MIRAFCKEIAPTWRKTQITNLARAAHAVFQRRTFTLSHLAQEFPSPDKPKVPEPQHPLWHRLKRLRRYLGNPHLKMEDLFQRLTRLSLSVSDEPGVRLSLLLDLTYLDPYAFLVASIPKVGRALPVAWEAFRRDLTGEPVQSQNEIIENLLRSLFARLPEGIQAILVADREFARAGLFRFLKGLRRGFVIRIDAETWISHRDYTGPLSGLGLKPGDPPRWFAAALYGKEEREPVNVLAVWKEGYDEPWLLATTLDDPDTVYSLYRQRMKIEHGFRDWKHHIRLKGTLWAENVTLVKGLMTVLGVLYWFVCLLGLHWSERKFWSKVACWGQPSFFKTAIDLLTSNDPVVPETWAQVSAWVHDKLEPIRPLIPTYLLRYRRHRPWLQQSG